MPETKFIISAYSTEYVNQVKVCLTETKNFDGAVKAASQSLEQLSQNPSTVSIERLKDRLSEARAELDKQIPGSAAYEAALRRIALLTNHVNSAHEASSARLRDIAKSYNISTNNLAGGSDKASYALVNLSRIASDAPYGFIGISNNIEPAVQSFIMLSKEAGGAKQAIAALATGIFSPTGALVAISGLTAAFTYYSMHSRGAKKDTDDLKDSVDSLKSSMKDMSRDTLNALSIAEQATISSLEALGGSKVKKTKYDIGLNSNVTYDTDRGLTDDEQKKLNNAKDRLKLLRDEISTLGQIDNARRVVNEKEKAWINARTTEERIVAKKALDEAKKDLELKEGSTKTSNTNITESELELHKLKYDLSKEDYDTYRGFLLKKIAASKDNTKDELENLKKVKDALKELDSSVNVVGFESEFKFPTEQQEKAFKQIKESFEQRGIVWNASAKAFAVYAVLEMKPGTSFGRELKPVDDKGIKNPLQESAKLTQEEMDDLSTRVGTTQRVFDEFGNSIIDSMFGAKMSIGEVTAELGKMMAKMALMKLMDLGINLLFGLPMGGLNSVAVAGHDVGGVIGYGQKNIIADPRIFYGAERFSEGGILGGIPIIGHKGEIILNERQQNNLIDLISSLTANRLNTTTAVQQVKVTGRLTADRMNFIGEVNSAQADYNNIIQAGGFDRA